MKCYVALILVAASLAGCKSQAPTADPFFGRTTIPPPPTGAVNCGDPGYQTPPTVQLNTPTPPGCPPASLQPPALGAAVPAYQPPASTSLPPGYQPPTSNLPQPLNYQPPSATAPQPLTYPAAPAGAAATQPGTWPNSSSGIAPNVLAPRPGSTAPGSFSNPRYGPATPAPATPAPATTAPPATSPYAPPGGNFNYRSSSTQNAPANSTGAAMTASISSNSRMPGPVDDGASVVGGLAGRKPIIRTIEPRASDDRSDRPLDIADLPKSPAGGP